MSKVWVFLAVSMAIISLSSGGYGKDELDRVQAVRANSKLTQTTVLDTQPTVTLTHP